jgi:hypothetical protein
MGRSSPSPPSPPSLTPATRFVIKTCPNPQRIAELGALPKTKLDMISFPFRNIVDNPHLDKLMSLVVLVDVLALASRSCVDGPQQRFTFGFNPPLVLAAVPTRQVVLPCRPRILAPSRFTLPGLR